jgi:hypothetical protein
MLPWPGEPEETGALNVLYPSRPLPAYWGNFCDAMKRHFDNLVSADSDWRRPLMEDARRVAELIESAAQDGDVKIVAHSRGGLVVRRALALLAQSDALPAVKRVVCMGTPHSGSLDAVINLAGWGHTPEAIATIGRYLPSAIEFETQLGSVNEVLKSWAAVYELLPHPSAPWLPENTPLALYEADNYSPQSPPARARVHDGRFQSVAELARAARQCRLDRLCGAPLAYLHRGTGRYPPG